MAGTLSLVPRGVDHSFYAHSRRSDRDSNAIGFRPRERL